MKQFVFIVVVMSLMACTQNITKIGSDSTQTGLSKSNNAKKTDEELSEKVVSRNKFVNRGDCSAKKKELALNAWKNTDAKKAIKDFVDRSIDEGGQWFVPVNQRVAVFDLDGTLWVEKPQKVMLSFVKKELFRQGNNQLRLRNKQPWKSVLNANDNYLSQLNFSTVFLSY
ncbi:MAG: ABC-type tungstate transport system permease subunit [Pseudohongiellaceae bacterium]|jgi:ABC-type tungstate transport system permease subunit